MFRLSFFHLGNSQGETEGGNRGFRGSGAKTSPIWRDFCFSSHSRQVPYNRDLFCFRIEQPEVPYFWGKDDYKEAATEWMTQQCHAKDLIPDSLTLSKDVLNRVACNRVLCLYGIFPSPWYSRNHRNKQKLQSSLNLCSLHLMKQENSITSVTLVMKQENPLFTFHD